MWRGFQNTHLKIIFPSTYCGVLNAVGVLSNNFVLWSKWKPGAGAMPVEYYALNLRKVNKEVTEHFEKRKTGNSLIHAPFISRQRNVKRRRAILLREKWQEVKETPKRAEGQKEWEMVGRETDRKTAGSSRSSTLKRRVVKCIFKKKNSHLMEMRRQCKFRTRKTPSDLEPNSCLANCWSHDLVKPLNLSEPHMWDRWKYLPSVAGESYTKTPVKSLVYHRCSGNLNALCPSSSASENTILHKVNSEALGADECLRMSR